MKKIFYTLIISVSLTFSALSAGSGGSSNSDSGGAEWQTDDACLRVSELVGRMLGNLCRRAKEAG